LTTDILTIVTHLYSSGIRCPWDVERERDEPLHEGGVVLEEPADERRLRGQANHLLHDGAECKLHAKCRPNMHTNNPESIQARKRDTLTQSFGI